MSMPPPGHPMHPEMIGLYGYPQSRDRPPPPIPTPPTPAEQARLHAEEGAWRDALKVAYPAVRVLLAEFVEGMMSTPTIDLADPANGLEAVKHRRYAVAYRRFGAKLGSGWYVSTPKRPAISGPSSYSRDCYSESTVALGLAVTKAAGAIPASMPNCFEMDAYGSDISMSVGLLALHTHGVQGTDAETIADVPRVLGQLLDAALASPVGLARRVTKREDKESRKNLEKWSEEQTFGPGGLKAYRKRMYGK